MITPVHNFVFPASNEIEKRREVVKAVRPGDIVFTEFTDTFSLKAKLDTSITLLQKVVKPFKKSADDKHHITHTAIVVAVDDQKGQILVAEAMPTKKKNELRVIDLLSDKSMVLDAKEPYEYHFFRMDEKRGGTLPQQAASIADNLSTRVGYLSQKRPEEKSKGAHRFSYADAFLSIFSKGASHQKRASYAKSLFEKVADDHLSRTDGCQKASSGKFFCSYFASHVYQQAEVASRLEQIMKLKGVKDGLDKIAKMPQGKARATEQTRWAAQMAKQHGKEIGDLVKTFTLDPKFTSPEQLMNFLTKDNLFREVVSLVPPKGETKKPTLIGPLGFPFFRRTAKKG